MASTIRFLADWSVVQVGVIRHDEEVRIEYARSRLPWASEASDGGDEGLAGVVTAYADSGTATRQGLTDWEPIGDGTIALDLTIPAPSNHLTMWFAYHNEADGREAWDSRFGENFQFDVASSRSKIGAHRARRSRASSDGWPAEANEAISDPACFWRHIYESRSVDYGGMKVVGYSPTAGAVVTALVDFWSSSAGSFIELAPTSSEDLARYEGRAEVSSAPSAARTVYPAAPKVVPNSPCNYRREVKPDLGSASDRSAQPDQWGSLLDHFYTVMRHNADNRHRHQGMVPTKVYRHYEREWEAIERNAVPKALAAARNDRGLGPVSSEDLSRAGRRARRDADALKVLRTACTVGDSCWRCGEEEWFWSYAAHCATLALGEQPIE